MIGLFEGPGLAISLPARELRGAMLPGSIFDRDALAAAPISQPLRSAIDLVIEACGAAGVTPSFVARPEIFTNGASLAWLQEKLPGVEDHLCISDGSTVRVLPGMRNHVFLYQLGVQENWVEFQRLAHRVPGFLASLSSQVNTAFRFRNGRRLACPPTCLLMPKGQPTIDNAAFLRFYLNPGSIEDSVARVIDDGSAEAGQAPSGAKVICVPLTEAACYDRPFCRWLGDAVARAYFDREACIVIGLPSCADAEATIADRVRAVVLGLRDYASEVPRLPATNVLLSVDHLGEGIFVGRDMTTELVIHETFEFWRYPRTFYETFSDITVLRPQGRQRDGLMPLLTEAFGRRPATRRLPRENGFLQP